LVLKVVLVVRHALVAGASTFGHEETIC